LSSFVQFWFGGTGKWWPVGDKQSAVPADPKS